MTQTPADDTGLAETLILLTSDIVAAHVSNNSVAVDDMAALISSVHAALAGLGSVVEEEAPPPEPAVSIRASIKPEYIVCLEDGKKLKLLKRHLMTYYNMTPEDYRKRWNLPADYPMVAPAYAEKRRELAKKLGLGRRPGVAARAKPAALKTAAKKATTGEAVAAKAAPRKRAPVRKPAAASNDDHG